MSAATGIKLGVNGKGQALISYTSGGKHVEVIAWGATNALAPTRGGKQIALQLDYSGGYTLFKTELAQLTAKLRHDQNVFKREETSASAKGKKYTPGITAASDSIRQDYAAIKKIHDQAVGYDKAFTCPGYTGPQLAWMVGRQGVGFAGWLFKGERLRTILHAGLRAVEEGQALDGRRIVAPAGLNAHI